MSALYLCQEWLKFTFFLDSESGNLPRSSSPSFSVSRKRVRASGLLLFDSFLLHHSHCLCPTWYWWPPTCLSPSNELCISKSTSCSLNPVLSMSLLLSGRVMLTFSYLWQHLTQLPAHSRHIINAHWSVVAKAYLDFSLSTSAFLLSSPCRTSKRWSQQWQSHCRSCEGRSAALQRTVKLTTKLGNDIKEGNSGIGIIWCGRDQDGEGLLSTSLLPTALVLCVLMERRQCQGHIMFLGSAVQDAQGWEALLAGQARPGGRAVDTAVEVTQTSSSKRLSFHRGQTWRQQTVIERKRVRHNRKGTGSKWGRISGENCQAPKWVMKKAVASSFLEMLES